MTIFKSLVCVVGMFASAFLSFAAEPYVLHTFQRIQLSDQFFCEGASYGDFNQDGIMDVVSGPYWYAGPNFAQRHEYYEAAPFDIAGYSKNFLAFTHDINGDDWQDIVIIGFPGEETWWFQNPQRKPGHWPRHVVLAVTDNESPTFTDITGDGRPDLVCSTAGQFGYAEIPKDDPTKPWTFQAITPNRGYQRYTHGMGVGDVNGDGRQDLLEKDGWWEQPKAAARDSKVASNSTSNYWAFHKVPFSEGGGAQMLVYDVDGDGDNDVVTSKAAHAYGLAWFENEGADNGELKFREHLIMGEKPEQNDYGVAFSQLHALALADMDGDGVQDVVTGKRFWAHQEHDPGSLEPAVLYWFRTLRDGGKVRFVPYKIDGNSGVGTQVVAGDLNRDDLADIVVGNKKGTFVFRHHSKSVDRETWEAAQPTPLRAPDAQAASKPPTAADGFPAKAADGRTLNLDFENGDLSDWTAEGRAFERQPIDGDTVRPRRSDSVSGHRGNYWIGTYERGGDGPQGTLTSVPFKVTHPYASFLIGGGSGGALRAEIVRRDTGEAVFSASGRAAEEMRTVVADLSALVGQEIFLRINDRASAGWGHVNFDHFRFHDELPPATTITAAAAPGERTADFYPHAGLQADEAVREMKLPEGFRVTVAAAEPDVKQPIAMAYDDRGRLWIAEAYEYPVPAEGRDGRDRILIFEDADGDGRFDKRKVFAEKLNLVSGLEVGFGGVWVGAAPYFMFIPDRNGDDEPDGDAEILLDGWAWQDTHETLNTFIWGPDGWLYGCHGVFTHSRVGKPGTPDSERIPLNAAIWRYHPTRHKFEIFAEGTSNPWGVDFDDHGQAFCTACVIPHLYHVIQGARYFRQAGSHFNPHTYDDIATIADHRHYLGDNPHGGNGKSNDAGGGHAHAGAMIYLGGAWPDEYRGRIFMNNIHGQRLNTDILKRDGSGFVGSHGPDFLLTGDLASQILNIRYGPDGNAYIIDWYDTNACHHNNVEGHDRSNGRIYKVSYGDKTNQPVDLRKLNDDELIAKLVDRNDWYVRHARRILQERTAAGTLDRSTRDKLRQMAIAHPQPACQLRAMWALHVTGGLPNSIVSGLLGSPNEYVRAWAVQLSLDRDNPDLAAVRHHFVALAQSDQSPVVRLYLASALQRMPLADRWNILEGLVRHSSDAEDHNLPLMYWYAAEPLAEEDPERALAFGLSCGRTIPLLREFIVRRIGTLNTGPAIALLVRALGESSDAEERLVILRGIDRALAGRRRVAPPDDWPAVFGKMVDSGNERLRSEATALGVKFGDAKAMSAFRELVAANGSDAKARQRAIKALLDARDPGLAATLQRLLTDSTLRAEALAGLAQYEDAQTPAKVLAVYDSLTAEEKRTALATLAARPTYGAQLLQSIAAKRIPKTDLSADLVRQLHNLRDSKVDELLAEIWGQVRPTAEDKARLIVAHRELLSDEPEIEPDLHLGRAIFAKTCQQCHKLYGVGDTIGPDLTGSNRSDLEYLLSNVFDPSGLIAKEYHSTLVVTADGRVVTGIVTAEDDKSLTIRTATETLVIPKDEIDERGSSDVSMMPDDQLKLFSKHEILSLFAYLRDKAQVPMLATKDNANLMFNGRDLAGWTGDSQLWSVENGEIVGRTAGIDHNTFLVSDLTVEDFRLSLEVKLVNDAGNSGVQFRSEPMDGFAELRGYQADIGPGWWGKLYEENGRALLWDKSGESHVKKGDWNRYEIEAVGTRIRTWINGQPCVDLDDPDGKRRGIIALQLHSGDATEVRFRNLQLQVK
jgi:putative membrane-bound dehydrogenase-like protein